MVLKPPANAKGAGCIAFSGGPFTPLTPPPHPSSVSFVSAVFYDANAADGSRGLQMATHAAGVDDRATGKPITTRGRIPSGSVTKTFTAALAMQLAEQGKLDLDAPVHLTVDPWLAAQSPPGKPLRALWGGDSESPLADTTVTPTIERVTARHLLSMRSGLGEYDDGKMQVIGLYRVSIGSPSRRARIANGGGGR